VVVGHHGPSDANLIQNGNHVFGEAGLRRKVAARVRWIGAPEDLHLAAMDAQLHLQGLVAHQWRQGVVIGEVDQVHARLAAAGGPTSGLLVVGIPVARVAQLAVGAEALDVFHQRAGIINLSPGVGVAEHAAERIVRPALVGGHTVVLAENAGEHFGRGMRSARVLLLDGVPRGFVMVAAPIPAIRPIDRLVQVPQPGGVDIGAGEPRPRREQAEGGAAGEQQAHPGSPPWNPAFRRNCARFILCSAGRGCAAGRVGSARNSRSP
jgi:hypothetical protein